MCIASIHLDHVKKCFGWCGWRPRLPTSSLLPHSSIATAGKSSNSPKFLSLNPNDTTWLSVPTSTSAKRTDYRRGIQTFHKSLWRSNKGHNLLLLRTVCASLLQFLLRCAHKWCSPPPPSTVVFGLTTTKWYLVYSCVSEEAYCFHLQGDWISFTWTLKHLEGKKSEVHCGQSEPFPVR